MDIKYKKEELSFGEQSYELLYTDFVNTDKMDLIIKKIYQLDLKLKTIIIHSVSLVDVITTNECTYHFTYCENTDSLEYCFLTFGKAINKVCWFLRDFQNYFVSLGYTLTVHLKSLL